ncbi:MAG: SPOR domain-containing protein [Marinifilaceae bacterium]
MRNLYFIICSLLISGALGLLSQYIDIESSDSKGNQDLYSIQLATLKYPVYLSHFKGVENVVELVGKDGLFRYCLKPFSGKEEVEKLLVQVHQQGYSEAKVIRLVDEFDQEALADSQQDDGKQQKIRVSASDKELEKIRSVQGKGNNQEKEIPVIHALSRMAGVGSSYFYSIQVLETPAPQKPDRFSTLKNVKEYSEEEGSYRYLHGNFADVEDAERYLSNELRKNYPDAKVVVVDKGNVVMLQQQVKISQDVRPVPDSKIQVPVKRGKGREFVDYFYEENQSPFPVTPVASDYRIELGPFKDRVDAENELQRLKKLGYGSARLLMPSTSGKKGEVNIAASSPIVYTIQIMANSKAVSISSFKLKGVRKVYSSKDGLYKYYYGGYDNYWVCRRKLRDVRNKGYRDAFIVKMKRK